MSKRSRITADEARRAGLNAWETPEGRRLLLKALNPNDTGVPTTGIPTLQCRNISVLNWQGEYTINAPENINANVPSYDSTLFLYQHPLIFGLSATRPSGCMDLREFDGYLHIVRQAGAAANTYMYSITCGSDPIKPVSMTRCARYLNNQIDPSLFKGDTSLAGRRSLFNQLTQKNRIIYGGATIIPTCSNHNNSGSLAVSQQVFSPRRSTLKPDSNVELNTFTDEDFPDTSDTVQNPQMYYGRYQDGAYIPYKLNEPASMPYVGSEQQVTTRCPYYVKGVSFIGPTQAADGNSNFTLQEVAAEYTPITVRQWTASCPTALYFLTGIRFYIQFYTGQSGYITVTLSDTEARASNILYVDENNTTKDTVAQPAGNNPAFVAEDIATEGELIPSNSIASYELNNLYIKMPTLFTAWQWYSNTDDLANPVGTYYVSQDITTSANVPADSELRRGTICPYNGQSIISVHTSGVSNTAPVKMILRYGAEILLVAASPYSPFKFMSPRYDESAIKSYARCIRAMKDAYFANAGSVPGQIDYINKLMSLIETDSAEDLNRTLNQGGTWYGVVQ